MYVPFGPSLSLSLHVQLTWYMSVCIKRSVLPPSACVRGIMHIHACAMMYKLMPSMRSYFFAEGGLKK